MLVSFFAVLGNIPSCCAASLSLYCRKQGSGGLQSWDITTEGWETWSVLLLCFSHDTHSCIASLPVLLLPSGSVLAFHHPCLSSPVQSLLDSEGNLLAAVSHPPRCILLLQKVGGFVICPLHLLLPIQTPSFLCDKKNTVIIIISPQEEMREGVGTKAGPLEIALSSMCLQMHSVCLLSWLPRRCLRDHWTLSTRRVWWVCDRFGLGRCNI